MTDLSNLLSTEQQAILLMRNLVLAGVILDSAEMLMTGKVFAEDGMFTWRTSRLDYPAAVRRALDPVFERIPFVYLMLFQLACAVVSFLLPSGYSAGFIAAILLIRLISGVRNGYHGREGADHMILILLACILLYMLAPGDLARRAVLWFIAAETVLAYMTAGVIKLRSPEWRRGTAIRNILLTKLFGSAFFGGSLSRWPRLSLAFSWAVIGFELSALFLVLSGYYGCLIFVSLGIIFHLGIAVTQGLNLFVWAFVAAYPSLLVTARDVSSFLSHGR